MFLENGQPKLGVRFVGNKIQEIQGELNNGKIPVSYFDETQRHIKEWNLKLGKKAENEIASAEMTKLEIEKIKSDLKDAIENNDVKEIFRYFDFLDKEDKYGFLTLKNYNQPSDKYSFRDLGIDENKLFKQVKEISGYKKFIHIKKGTHKSFPF